MQLTQLESDWDEFDRGEVRIICIPAQKVAGVLSAKKFVEKHNYRFPILFDESREITKPDGVYHQFALDEYRIPRPAAFLRDESRKVQWIAVSPNQSELPTNARILEAIEVVGKY